MNLNAPELIDTTKELANKIGQGIDLSSITSLIKLPQLDGLSEVLSGILPKNLTLVGEDGTFKLPGKEIVNGVIDGALDAAKPLIENEIRGTLEKIQNNLASVQKVANIVESSIDSVSDVLGGLQGNFFDNALQNISNLTGSLEDISAVSKLQTNIDKALDPVKNFSPKQIRDLQKPEIFNEVLTSTLEEATSLIKNDALQTALEFIKPSEAIAAAGSLGATSASLLGRIGPKIGDSSSGGKYTTAAVVSYFYGQGDGADLDAYKRKTATGKKLISGKSCAVDNVTILLGSKVKIPGAGTFEAVDIKRGSNADILMFFDTFSEASKAYRKLTSDVTAVEVTPPKNISKKEKVEIEKVGTPTKSV